MTASALDPLLEPESLAVVGLSDDAGKHGGRVLANLRKLGYGGQVWGVNPRLPEVEGAAVFASLHDLPGVPDLVVCAVPAPVVPGVVAAAGELGVGAAVVFAGGFAESGAAGESLQEALKAAAATGIRVLGPNSGGVIRPSHGLAVSFLTCLDRPAEQVRSGPVGLVTQSGGTGSYIHNLAAARGGGLAASVSTGNEVDIQLGEAVAAVAAISEVRAVAVVVEAVRDGTAFVEAVEAAHRQGKPVVVCRIGGSRAGGRLTATHTGAIATPARVLDGVLDALGVTVTETPGELLDVAEVMARTPPPAGPRVGIVTHSGGVAILLADLASRAGVPLPEPDADLSAALAPLLDHGAARNPLDMGGIIGGPGRFAAVVDLFAGSGLFDSVLAVSTAHPPAHTSERAATLAALDPPGRWSTCGWRETWARPGWPCCGRRGGRWWRSRGLRSGPWPGWGASPVSAPGDPRPPGSRSRFRSRTASTPPSRCWPAGGSTLPRGRWPATPRRRPRSPAAVTPPPRCARRCGTRCSAPTPAPVPIKSRSARRIPSPRRSSPPWCTSPVPCNARVPP